MSAVVAVFPSSVARTSVSHRTTECRGVPVQGRSVRVETRHRLLHDPSVHPEHPHRHPVMGVLLDQHRGVSRSRVHRPAHRADDDDPKHRAGVAAEGQLREGDRRVDVYVPTLRIRVAARVRRRQCPLAPVGEDGKGDAAASACAAQAHGKLLRRRHG